MIEENRTVIETIKKFYEQIFSAERKVADYILKFPEAAVDDNVSELANHSGVSDATVIRFCKHIGYQGYYQMRINLSRDLGRKQVVVPELENMGEDTVASLFQSYIANFITIGKNLSQDTLIESANVIKKSKQVHIVAVGNTGPLALYMGFRLGRLGVRCTYNTVTEYFMNHVNLADKEDSVIAISKSGSSKQVIQAMELAKEKGLKIIAITAYESSPVSQLADYLLPSGVKEGKFNYYKDYSHLSETAVIDALLYFVTNEEDINAKSADKPEMILSDNKL